MPGFFDDLSGFVSQAGGYAGNLAGQITQVGNAIGQVRGAFGGGSPNGAPTWGPGTPFVQPTPIRGQIGPPTHAPASPLVLIGLAGLALYLVAKK